MKIKKYLDNEEIRMLGDSIKAEVPLIDYFYYLENKDLVERSPKTNFESDEDKWIYWKNLVRNEVTPSLALNTEDNYFKDFGDDECKGDIFAAVRYFEGLNYPLAVRKLADMFLGEQQVNIARSQAIKGMQQSSNSSYSPSVELKRVSDEITNPKLISYLSNRGFSEDAVKKFCSSGYIKEVAWSNLMSGKQGIGIGFQSGDGCYAVSAPMGKKSYKFNIGPVRPILISLSKYKTDEIKVFEGFFDFLAYTQLDQKRDFKALVLNSVIHKKGCIDIIEKEASRKPRLKVSLYLDGDKAGDKLTMELIKHFRGRVSIDDRFYFEKKLEFKDVNECLIEDRNTFGKVYDLDIIGDDGYAEGLEYFIRLFSDRAIEVMAPEKATEAMENLKIFFTECDNYSKSTLDSKLIIQSRAIHGKLCRPLECPENRNFYNNIPTYLNDSREKVLGNLSQNETLRDFFEYFSLEAVNEARSVHVAKLKHNPSIICENAFSGYIRYIDREIKIKDAKVTLDKWEKLKDRVINAFKDIRVRTDTEFLVKSIELLEQYPSQKRLDDTISALRKAYILNKKFPQLLLWEMSKLESKQAVQLAQPRNLKIKT